jgi:hypothetical protein
MLDVFSDGEEHRIDSDSEFTELGKLFLEVTAASASELLKWGAGVTSPVFDACSFPVPLKSDGLRLLSTCDCV